VIQQPLAGWCRKTPVVLTDGAPVLPHDPLGVLPGVSTVGPPPQERKARVIAVIEDGCGRDTAGVAGPSSTGEGEATTERLLGAPFAARDHVPQCRTVPVDRLVTWPHQRLEPEQVAVVSS
jgi:hypothetical protein